LSKKVVVIYARASTDRQTVDMQIHELKEYVKRRGMGFTPGIHRPGLLRIRYKKPAFIEMMNEAKKRKFDILLVWKLD
jgi:DNA invertase Pin-like site-specific DNA recombinase